MLGYGFLEQRIQLRHRFHDLGSVLLIRQTFIDLEEGHHFLHFPQVVGSRLTFDVTIHGVFKQDGAHYALAVESRAGDDAGAHLVNDPVHAFFIGPCIRLDAVQAQRFRGAATALIERGNEPGLGFDFLFLVVESAHCDFPQP